MTAAICLQGTAQSGQEQDISMSDHFEGKRRIPNFSQTVRISGSSSRAESFATINGDFAISSKSFVTCSDEISGSLSLTV